MKKIEKGPRENFQIHKRVREIKFYTSVSPEVLKPSYYPVQIRTVQLNLFTFTLFPIPVKSKTTARRWTGEETKKLKADEKRCQPRWSLSYCRFKLEKGREKKLQPSEFHSLWIINGTGIF